DRTLRADAVRRMVLDGPTPPGARLRIRGAAVVGRFDLAGVQLDVDLGFEACVFDGDVDLSGSAVHAVTITRATLPRLLATGLTADTVTLDGSRIGTVNLSRARVRGPVSLEGCDLGRPADAGDPDDGAAVVADGMAVDGGLSLRGARVHAHLDLADVAANLGVSLDTVVADDGYIVVDLTRSSVGRSLTLDAFRLSGVLQLPGARVAENVDLSNATVSTETWATAVDAGGLIVGGGLHAWGTALQGRLDLRGARIDGGLLVERGSFAAQGAAMDLSRATLGRLELTETPVKGKLDATRVVVQGDLRIHDSRLDPPPTDDTFADDDRADAGLSATGAEIDGSVTLYAVEAHGAVTFAGAAVRGGLDLTDVRLAHPFGVALDLARAVVQQETVLTSVTAAGEVRVADARLGEGFAMHDCMLIDATHNVDGTRLVVEGNLLVTDLSADSGVRLTFARVGNEIDLRTSAGASPATVELNGVQATSIDLSQCHAQRVDLRAAQTYTLVPNVRVPTVLRGTAYQQLITDDDSAGALVRWLDRDPEDLVPQTLEHLAAYLANAGREADARRVRLTIRRRQRRSEGLGGRLGGFAVDAAAGYGYAPSRAFLWLCVFWAMAALWFGNDPPTPVDPANHDWNVSLYSLDLLLPASPFGVEGDYDVGGAGEWVWVVVQTMGYLLTIPALAAINRAFNR
ncbi:MAG: hypothetical protein HOV79_15045, partial [Hamadaea sp.]|nr:hypothetical protein [Hamadaea sp.]